MKVLLVLVVLFVASAYSKHKVTKCRPIGDTTTTTTTPPPSTVTASVLLTCKIDPELGSCSCIKRGRPWTFYEVIDSNGNSLGCCEAASANRDGDKYWDPAQQKYTGKYKKK